MSSFLFDPRQAFSLAIVASAAWLSVNMGSFAIAEEKRIEGSAAYRERIALHPDAELLVKLQDVSLQDVAATMIASMRYPTGGRVPISFSLPYQSELIKQGHTYSVSAELVHERKTIFRTTSAYPVLTRDAGDTVELLLVSATAEERTSPTPDEQAAPIGSWMAEDIGGGGVIDNLQSTLAIDANGSAYGKAGCNRYTGSAEFDDAKLIFGQMALTMMACEGAVDDQERKFLDAISKTKGYRRDGDFLYLLGEDGSDLARLIKHDG